MTLQDLAAIGNAVSGVAVIVTLVYLAIQIRQSTQIERAAGQRDLLSQLRGWVELTASDPPLFDVLRRGARDWASLPPPEQEQFHAWALSLLLLAEQALYMRNDRFVNEGSFRGIEQAALSVVATPGGRAWWGAARHLLGKDISQHIDGALARRPADAPHWSELLPHWGRAAATTAAAVGRR
jgi:hypothetical protein